MLIIKGKIVFIKVFTKYENDIYFHLTLLVFLYPILKNENCTFL